jgi:hypothetical protein
VAGRQDKAIAVEPFGVGGIVLEETRPQHVRKRGCTHRKTGCPLLAFWTASIDKKRIVLMDKLSRSTGDEAFEIFLLTPDLL